MENTDAPYTSRDENLTVRFESLDPDIDIIVTGEYRDRSSCISLIDDRFYVYLLLIARFSPILLLLFFCGVFYIWTA